MIDSMMLNDWSFRSFVMPRCPYSLAIGSKAGSDILIADSRIAGVCARLFVRIDTATRLPRMTLHVFEHLGIEINNEIVESGKDYLLNDAAVITVFGIRMCICRYHLFMQSSTSVRTSLVEVNPLNIRDVTKSVKCVHKPFSPVPRSSLCIDYSPIELELPPARRIPDKQPLILAVGPALTMAVPILLGAGRKIMVIAGMIAALWAGLNVAHQRKKNHKEEVLRRKAYLKYVKECETSISDRARNIRNALNVLYPNAIESFRVGGDIHHMWNRNVSDSDYGNVRVGIGEMIFPVEIKSPKDKFSVVDDSLRELPERLRAKYKMINDVPICIDLLSQGPFAIVTSTVNDRNEIIVSIILQMCIAYKPDEFKVAACIGDVAKIQGILFLPHTWNGKMSYIDINGSRKSLIIDDIERNEECRAILFTDDIDLFNHALTLTNCIVIFSDNSYSTIPPGVCTVLECDREFSGLLHMGVDKRRRENVHFDRIGLDAFLIMAKNISSLYSNVFVSLKPIPDKVLLTELLGEENLSSHYIENLWSESLNDFSLSVPIGKKENDEVIMLDADEKSCGPHGLIAGTTGSGKSELLQTYILSLSYRFPPWQVSFFLIDYKGGGMANMFSDLPHVAGTISNLSGAVSERAMVSVKSENTLRQQIFAEYGVNNIHDYQMLYEKGITTTALPHIFIIIDEFAELKKEEPDFMQQLISVAQVGRSLGVHLILATQKPAGCVDDKIWSNSRFRICLKVRDRADSMDMLHTKDAAYITNVGRAYLQVGNDEIYQQFQCAYTMAPMNRKKEDIGYTLFDGNLDVANDVLKFIRSDEKESYDVRSQMVFLKELINEAYSKSSQRDVPRLWLDELPCNILPSGFDVTKEGLSIGIYDDPSKRVQKEIYYDISKWGNTMIIGLPASGKSTLIMRILTCLCADFDSKDLGIYIVDCGGDKLAVFKQSRLCGGYVPFEECQRIPQLIGFVKNEYTKRKSKGAKDYSNILVVIDNFGSMALSAGEEIVADIAEVMRDGTSVGIYFLIAAMMISGTELPGKMSVLCESAISFLQRDKYSYAGIFSSSPNSIPLIDAIPGRGLVREDKEIFQFQAFTPMPIEEDEWQNAITHVIESANKRILTPCKHYPFVPKDPCFCDFAAQCAALNEDLSTFSVPIGYEVQSGHIYSLPITEFGVCLIVGRRKSGRKNTLEIIEKMANIQGIETFRFFSINELSTFLIDGKKGIALCDSLLDSINRFYDEDYDRIIEDSLYEYLSLTAYEPEKANLKIVFVMNSKDRNCLAGRKLWNAIAEHPYVIALGGLLSELTYFDFSYVPFTIAAKRKPCLSGDVAFYDDDLFCGSIVIPRIGERYENN